MPEPDIRFNVISETGDGSGFSIRLKDEGYPVRLWIRNQDAKSIADRMVEKAGDLEDLLYDADPERDVFLFDTTGNGVIADYLGSEGYAVLGGSVLADRLERDRTFGYEVMSQAGIELPETKSFIDFDEAIAFVEKNSTRRWVYKPSKQLGDLSASHVAADAEDLIEHLRNVQHEVEIADPQFELQEFEVGTALSTELWFSRGELIEPLVNHTLERKELMDGDIGPSGGCTGNLTWLCAGCEACRLARQLSEFAQAVTYHGPLDINTIVTETGIYGLEFTPRLGYDAGPTLLWEILQGSVGEFFSAAARGEITGLELGEGFAGGVRVTIPPWPTEKFTAEENVPIRGLSAKDEKAAYWYNVKKDSDDRLVTAGGWGIVGLFTGYSPDPGGAMAKAVNPIRSLKLKNKQYRTDLGQVFAQDLSQLESLGVEIATHVIH